MYVRIGMSKVHTEYTRTHSYIILVRRMHVDLFHVSFSYILRHFQPDKDKEKSVAEFADFLLSSRMHMELVA